MKYKVAVEVKGKVFVDVEADAPEMARCRAEGVVCDYDFGVAKNLDFEAFKATDENGNKEYF